MTEVVAGSAKADRAQGVQPENLSGTQDQKGSAAPAPLSNKPPEKVLTPEEELKRKQGLADEPDEGDDAAVEEEDKPDEKWDGQYIQFNDESADSVVDLLKEAGVGGREADLIFREAMDNDDLSKVKWDVLEEKLGAAKAKLAKVAITDYYTRVYSRHVATTASVHKEVGGKENWDKVAKWVIKSEKADPTKKGAFDEIRKGIDAGGKLAVYAAKELKALYEADGKNKGLGNGKIVRGDNAGAGVTVGAPLNKQDYNAAIKKAHADRASPAEIAELRARRQAGLQKGWR